MENTQIILNIDAYALLTGLIVFSCSLLAIVWKGKKEIAEEIKKSLGDLPQRFMSVENKMEILWKDEVAPSHSPRQLNERGQSILNESGIKRIIDANRGKLFDLVRERGASNPYDAENAIEEVVSRMPEYFPDTIDELKNGAFATGVDIDTLLYVGSIYLRNSIFEDLGFSVTDLDKKK